MSDRHVESGEAAIPPPAPPLPPQPSSARAAANAVARFAQNISYGARPTATAQTRPRESATPGLTIQRSSRSDGSHSLLFKSLYRPPIDPPLKSPQVTPGVDRTSADRSRSPISSRSTTHRTGIPIAALDISPCRTRAILAGRDILKTVIVSGSTCSEDYNLREKIVRYAATHETTGGAISAKHKDQLAANDVKWSHGEHHTTIATAAANGQIVVYDLNRAGVELARLHEHNRQVHRLGFNPHRGSLLLSGSQDATTRLWDLRALAGERSVMTCQSKSRYAGNSEGIRDLKWSPTNGVEFATGTDSGVVQRWDIRKESSPTLKINAHEKTCNSIDWHPDGKHLVSGSADKRVKVWDFSSSDRRMKPLWQLRVPQAALNVRWRPASWSSEDHRPGGWGCTQLAVSYDKEDPRIHIWDLRRPSVPFRVLDRYDTPPTALLWHSEDLLWSVGPAGMFTQTDVKFTPKTMDGYNVNPISIAPDGQILFASMRRERKRLSIEDVTDNLMDLERRGTSKAEKNNASHSSIGGSHEEPSLLSSSFKTRRSKVPNSLRSARSMDSTPPSAGPDDPVLPLDQSLHEKYINKSPQVIGIGYIPGLFDADAFKFMARHYKRPPDLPAGDMGFNLHLILNDTFKHNSRVAAYAGKHRLSQSWRILGLAIEKEFGKRAEHNYQLRIAAVVSEAAEERASSQITGTLPLELAGNNKMFALEISQPAPKTAISMIAQNHSNMTTPLARPVPGPSAGIDPINNIAALDQKPALRSPELPKAKKTNESTAEVSNLAEVNSPDYADIRKESDPFQPENTFASFDGYVKVEPKLQSPSRNQPTGTGFAEMDRQMAERRAAMGNYRAQPRPVLKLDDPFQGLGSAPKIPNLGRHDSNESFQMFSASTDSSHRARSTMGSFESNVTSEKLGQTPEEVDGVRRPEKAHDMGQAENAMAFDDEAEMLPTQDSPTSPKSSMTSDRDPANTSLQPAATSSMPSLKRAQYEPPRINYRDMHPLNSVEPPPEEDVTNEDHKYIEADYFVTLPEDDDPPACYPPWTATAMFLPLVSFHCESLFDSQFPAYLLLHLAPYLHIPLQPFRAREIIFSYHDRLTSLQLYTQAAELRNHCLEAYPDVAARGNEDIETGGPWCTNCKKPSRGNRPKYCERCKQTWADCAICHGHGLISTDRKTDIETVEFPRATNPKAGDALWGWCATCGHGGHMGCLRAFWNFDQEGACPTVGCMCDCMPGKRREEIHKQLEEDWKKKPGMVSKDSWNVKESSAVQRTRSMVGPAEAGRSILQQSGRSGSGRGDGGGGPQSLGAAGRSASGGKKVRIVVPDDREGSKGKGKEGAGSLAP